MSLFPQRWRNGLGRMTLVNAGPSLPISQVPEFALYTRDGKALITRTGKYVVAYDLSREDRGGEQAS